MITDFTKYWSHLIDKSARELPEGPLDPRAMKSFSGIKFDSQLIEWLKNVAVFSHHVFADGSISLNFTGREFKDWLRIQEKDYREKFV